MKILIVEDEMLIAEDISEILEEMGHETIGIADNYEAALNMAANNRPDLALLDIRIKGEKNGIAVGNALAEKYSVRSIFLTSHSDKGIVQKAIEANPISYLLKPIKEEELYIALQVAWSQLAVKKDDNYLSIKIGSVKHKFRLKDITHLESDGNYTHFYVNTEKFTSSINMKSWLDEEDFKDFVRVHRSYAINSHHLNEISSKGVKIGDLQIPIGRKYKDSI